MQIEQAIFTSAQTSRARGYHLVARSPGVDESLAQQLAHWSPSENSLIDRDLDADSLNVFAIDENWSAISRTIYAGAEYSDRGQFRMETNMIVVRRSQLAGYDYDPLALARAALASGYLRLRSQMSTTLPALSLPASLGTTIPPTGESEDAPILVREILSRCDDQRLVIIGCTTPLDLMRQLFRYVPTDRRPDLSFSTGLKPSTHRPFRLQFLPAVNDELVRELDARGMTCLMA